MWRFLFCIVFFQNFLERFLFCFVCFSFWSQENHLIFKSAFERNAWVSKKTLLFVGCFSLISICCLFFGLKNFQKPTSLCMFSFFCFELVS